jgi:hypothetical protein
MTALRRQSPREAGFDVEMAERGCGHLSVREQAVQPHERIDRRRIPGLLRHHADYVDTLLVAICEGAPISLAGRQAMAYTADRLREFAEALA